MTKWADQPKSHSRRVGKGPQALKRRRQQALYNLEQVKEPDKRQQEEIAVLQKRTSRAN